MKFPLHGKLAVNIHVDLARRRTAEIERAAKPKSKRIYRALPRGVARASDKIVRRAISNSESQELWKPRWTIPWIVRLEIPREKSRRICSGSPWTSLQTVKSRKSRSMYYYTCIIIHVWVRSRRRRTDSIRNATNFRNGRKSLFPARWFKVTIKQRAISAVGFGRGIVGSRSGLRRSRCGLVRAIELEIRAHLGDS